MISSIILIPSGITWIALTDSHEFLPGGIPIVSGWATGMVGAVWTVVLQAKRKQIYWFIATFAIAIITTEIAFVGGIICALIYLLIPANQPIPAGQQHSPGFQQPHMAALSPTLPPAP